MIWIKCKHPCAYATNTRLRIYIHEHNTWEKHKNQTRISSASWLLSAWVSTIVGWACFQLPHNMRSFLCLFLYILWVCEPCCDSVCVCLCATLGSAKPHGPRSVCPAQNGLCYPEGQHVCVFKCPMGLPHSHLHLTVSAGVNIHTLTCTANTTRSPHHHTTDEHKHKKKQGLKFRV